MWINHQILHWNPWDTDRHMKKRWCHIKGMQKMAEYYLIKQKKEHDRLEKEQKKGSKGGGGGGAGKFSEFHKVSYADKDMNKLATENKGTTSAYSYS
jgi:hypothetical protein